MDSSHGDGVLLRRVAPFGDPRIDAYVQLPEAFRSLSRPSSAPDAKASPLRSFQLDLFWFSLSRIMQTQLQDLFQKIVGLPLFFAFPLLPCFSHHYTIVQFSRCSFRHKARIQCLFLSIELQSYDLVEISGIEPLTSCLQGRRSPS